MLAWITANQVIDTVCNVELHTTHLFQTTFPFSDADVAGQALKTIRRVFFGINGNDIIHIAVEELDEAKVKQVMGK